MIEKRKHKLYSFLVKQKYFIAWYWREFFFLLDIKNLTTTKKKLLAIIRIPVIIMYLIIDFVASIIGRVFNTLVTIDSLLMYLNNKIKK